MCWFTITSKRAVSDQKRSVLPGCEKLGYQIRIPATKLLKSRSDTTTSPVWFCPYRNGFVPFFVTVCLSREQMVGFIKERSTDLSRGSNFIITLLISMILNYYNQDSSRPHLRTIENERSIKGENERIREAVCRPPYTNKLFPKFIRFYLKSSIILLKIKTLHREVNM